MYRLHEAVKKKDKNEVLNLLNHGGETDLSVMDEEEKGVLYYALDDIDILETIVSHPKAKQRINDCYLLVKDIEKYTPPTIATIQKILADHDVMVYQGFDLRRPVTYYTYLRLTQEKKGSCEYSPNTSGYILNMSILLKCLKSSVPPHLLLEFMKIMGEGNLITTYSRLRAIGADPFTFSDGLDKLLDIIYNIKKAKADLEILYKINFLKLRPKNDSCTYQHFFPFAKDQYIGKVVLEKSGVYTTLSGIFNNKGFMIRGASESKDDWECHISQKHDHQKHECSECSECGKRESKKSLFSLSSSLYGDFFPDESDSIIKFIGVSVYREFSNYEYRFGTFKLNKNKQYDSHGKVIVVIKTSESYLVLDGNFVDNYMIEGEMTENGNFSKGTFMKTPKNEYAIRTGFRTVGKTTKYYINGKETSKKKFDDFHSKASSTPVSSPSVGLTDQDLIAMGTHPDTTRPKPSKSSLPKPSVVAVVKPQQRSFHQRMKSLFPYPDFWKEKLSAQQALSPELEWNEVELRVEDPLLFELYVDPVRLRGDPAGRPYQRSAIQRHLKDGNFYAPHSLAPLQTQQKRQMLVDELVKKRVALFHRLKGLKDSPEPLTAQEMRVFNEIIDSGRQRQALELSPYLDFLEMKRNLNDLSRLQALQKQKQAQAHRSVSVPATSGALEEQLIEKISDLVYNRLRADFKKKTNRFTIFYDKKNLADKAIRDTIKIIMDEEVQKGVDKKMLKKIKEQIIKQFEINRIASNYFQVKKK
uniref:U-box domain-containing protein n=1 Tax=viral metagenome TaxID=1070528 RepID=A0A6C0K1W4_9ZZZZ